MILDKWTREQDDVKNKYLAHLRQTYHLWAYLFETRPRKVPATLQCRNRIEISLYTHRHSTFLLWKEVKYSANHFLSFWSSITTATPLESAKSSCRSLKVSINLSLCNSVLLWKRRTTAQIQTIEIRPKFGIKKTARNNNQDWGQGSVSRVTILKSSFISIRSVSEKYILVNTAL